MDHSIAQAGRRLRLAVVGSGVSGLVTAYLLRRDHDVTLIEAADYLGGHTNTIDVDWAGARWPVDTGFIVFNDWTYPSFIKLLQRLGVESQESAMSFSVRCERSGLEYNGHTLNTLFAQRRNLVRPAFHRMLRDILRFNRESRELLDGGDPELTVGQYLDAGDYSDWFVDYYIVPMGAAIWSARPAAMLDMPAAWFVRFFDNHGMLSLDDRPTWRVVRGGSRSYVDALATHLAAVETSSPVRSIRRFDDHVEMFVRGERRVFDGVVIATHSDTALRLLADPSSAEREILGAIPYQENEAVLHVDERQMPRRRRAWAAWNYHVSGEPRDRVAVTYNLNILQRLPAPVQFMVTLNRTDHIVPDRVLRRIVYHHPVFTDSGLAAQRRWREINGSARTWYCGAYWGFGFHEDGVKSALTVARDFGVEGIA